MIGIHTIEAAEVGKLYEIRWNDTEIDTYNFQVFDSNLRPIVGQRLKITSGIRCLVVKHNQVFVYVLVGDQIVRLRWDDSDQFELFPIHEE